MPALHLVAMRGCACSTHPVSLSPKTLRATLGRFHEALTSLRTRLHLVAEAPGERWWQDLRGSRVVRDAPFVSLC